MNPKKLFNNLCQPAKLNFLLSILTIIIILTKDNDPTEQWKNLHNKQPYDTTSVIVYKLSLALFWAFVLNVLCKNGYQSAAWALTLLPYAIFVLYLYGWVEIDFASGGFQHDARPAMPDIK